MHNTCNRTGAVHGRGGEQGRHAACRKDCVPPMPFVKHFKRHRLSFMMRVKMALTFKPGEEHEGGGGGQQNSMFTLAVATGGCPLCKSVSASCIPEVSHPIARMF